MPTNRSQQGTSWPSYVTVEYVLGIAPDDLTRAQLQAFGKSIFGTALLQSSSHIIVAGFSGPPEIESTVCRWLQRSCQGVVAFQVFLSAVKQLSANKIVITIENGHAFQPLQSSLKKLGESFQALNIAPPSILYNYHLELSGGSKEINPAVFNEKLITKKFAGQFMADRLILLKRHHQFDSCSMVQSFALSNNNRSLYNREGSRPSIN